MKPPSAPVVAGALSGFVVGVFLTLLATGTVSHQSVGASPTATPPPPTILTDAQLVQHIDRIVARILGPLPSDPKRSRLLRPVQLSPIASNDVDPSQELRFSAYRSVLITFRLNDHPFGRAWRVRAAKADVFAVLRALYTSQLYIYDVQLDGKFPLDPKKPNELQTAVRAYISHQQATGIQWHRLGRSPADEAALWQKLTIHWIDPRFG